MSAETDLIAAIVAVGEGATLDLPHVVVAVDPFAPDAPILYGPFLSPVEASRFAESHSRAYIDDEYPEPIECTIVPVFPA